MRRAHERQLERQTKRSRRLTKRAALATGAALGATVVFAPSAQAAPFTVDTNADTPPDGCNNPDTTDECTLREAVYDANATPAPDTVTFAPTVTGEITLVASGGDINIHEPLDIQGPGAGTLAVSGDSNANDMADSGDSRIFRVDPNADGDPVSISDLTLKEGYTTGYGGAVLSYNAELTIADSVLTDNYAITGGGAVNAFGGDEGTLTVTGSEVSDNIAGNSGGGIKTRSRKDGGTTLTISDTEVSDNTAMNGRGGGIDIDNLYAAGVIDDSTISGNSAPDPGSGDGGGINVGDLNADNSPTDLTPGSLTVSNVTISDNDAGEDGGGVYLEDGSEGDESFANVTISGNTAGDDGGGVYIDDTDGAVTMSATTVSGNSANQGGGIYLDDGTGAITIDKSTISANSSSRQGGGMFVDRVRAPVTIQNSTVSGNSAIDPADGQGGGIYADNLTAGEPLTILNSTIAANAATNGGGIFRATAAPVLRSTIVADNSAQDGDLAQGIGAGGFFDVGFSLIEDRGTATISESPVGSNSFDLDPQLGPLAANGGSTQTHLPALSSPAIDAAVANGFATDQRGSPRTVNQSSIVNRSGSDGTDIGSVELAQQGGQPPTPAQTLCQDVESKRLDGTAANDSLTGTDGIDSIFGLAGNDILNGAIGPDCLDGGPGKDNLKGSGGKDLLRGGADNDKLRGQGGKDKLKGGAGDDNLIGDEGADNVAGGAGADKVSGGPAKDRIKGSGGADKLNAVDENKDSVICGGGQDEATVDAQDKVSKNCENVTVVN